MQTDERSAPSYLIFGAGGRTGDLVLKEAIGRNLTVHAVEHHWPSEAEKVDGVTYHTADVLTDDLVPLMEGIDGVISCLGVGLSPEAVMDPPPLYTEGTLRIAKAMQAANVRRIAVISAAFVDPATPLPAWFKATALTGLKLVFQQMGDMERVLRATSGIDWTAVRPGWLLDEPKTGDYRIADGQLPDDVLRTRFGDLAEFLVTVMQDDSYIGKTPAIGRKEDWQYTNPAALLREFT